MRSLRIGPLLVAVAVCALFALFGTALVGESLGNWYGALDKPWFLIPLWAFGIVGAISDERRFDLFVQRADRRDQMGEARKLDRPDYSMFA